MKLGWKFSAVLAGLWVVAALVQFVSWIGGSSSGLAISVAGVCASAGWACSAIYERRLKQQAIPAPLTDEQVLDLLPVMQSGWSQKDYGMWVARATERAHAIRSDR